MAIVSTSTMPPAIQLAFDNKILATPTQKNIHGLFALKATKAKRTGEYYRFKRYEELPTALVPLSNTGETPAPVQPESLFIDAKIQHYGQWMSVNEQVDLNSQDPVLNQLSIRFGVALRKTEDQLIRNMLATSATLVNCVAGTNGNIPSNITRYDIDQAVQTLRGNDAVYISDSIEGANKFGTGPVRNAFFGMCDTDLSTEISNTSGYIDVANYPSQGGILSSEIGAVGGIRFLTSSGGSKSVGAGALTGTDVYNVFVTGMESYTSIQQSGATAKFIYRPPELNDPLAQNYTLGWKMSHASRILNDLWILRLACTLA